jgi:hypothetical protein
MNSPALALLGLKSALVLFVHSPSQIGLPAVGTGRPPGVGLKRAKIGFPSSSNRQQALYGKWNTSPLTQRCSSRHLCHACGDAAEKLLTRTHCHHFRGDAITLVALGDRQQVVNFDPEQPQLPQGGCSIEIDFFFISFSFSFLVK